jgi:ABC-type nitrate/sulfonate/bicarbonate transport system permease component
VLLWYILTETSVLPRFFFGEPLLVARRVWQWLGSGR